MLAREFIKPEDQEPNIEGFGFYLDAFGELSTCRPGGMDLLPIPFTAIAEYSRIYDIPESDEFRALIRAMDNTFLKLHGDLQRREQSKNGANNTDPKNSSKR